jgi:hypothetical protein
MRIGTDRAEANQVRDEAIQRSYDAAHERWKQTMDEVIYAVARLRTEFTTDDVWDYFERTEVVVPKETRSLGRAMQRAHLEGWIVPTDRVVNSDRPRCHRRPVRVWRSLLEGI